MLRIGSQVDVATGQNYFGFGLGLAGLASFNVTGESERETNRRVGWSL